MERFIKSLALAWSSIFLKYFFAIAAGSILLSSGWVFSQAPANDNCSNATPLSLISPGGACTSGSTQNGTIQGGEDMSCFSGGAGCNLDQTVWYQFNSGSNDSLWIDFDVTNSPNCVGGYNIYGPFNSPTCFPNAFTSVACENVPPSTEGTMLRNLTQNRIYMIQVVGRNGGGSGDRYLDFCLGVEIPETCHDCNNPCGGACGFPSTPTVTQVTSSCPLYDLAPHRSDGDSGSWCYNLTATATSIDFGLIINQLGCAGGNISAMSWEVYELGSCGTPVATGTFPALTATGLTNGTNYTFCYSLTVAASCTHMGHYPYFVGAQLLDIPVTNFQGTPVSDGILLSWVGDQDPEEYYVLERSLDGILFEMLDTLHGSEKSSVAEPMGNFAYLSSPDHPGKTKEVQEFSYLDKNPFPKNYYRLKMVRKNGETEYGDILAVNFNVQTGVSAVWPNPATDITHFDIMAQENTEATIIIIDNKGAKIMEKQIQLSAGTQTVELPTGNLQAGVYMASVNVSNQVFIQKLVVQ